MGPHYRALMTDYGGNGERLVYIYDDRVLEQAEEVGELTVPPSMQRHIALPGVDRVFTGFDRPPYLATFTLRGVPWSIQMANVHLYYGSDAEEDRERRALETAAIARWARLRAKSEYLGARQLMVIGDFNMPKARRDGGNVVYDALTSKGLVLPAHSTQIGSSIASDNRYDQVAVLPGSFTRPGDLSRSSEASGGIQTGVFDFDAVVFRELWDRGDREAFNEYVRYYLSDHRVMWVTVCQQSS